MNAKIPTPSRKSCRLSMTRISTAEWNRDYEYAIYKRGYYQGIKDFRKLNKLLPKELKEKE
jgi:hypothetical protein